MTTDRAKARARAKRQGWNPAWIRTDADVRAVLRGCRFDLDAAERVRDFFAKFLRHSKGQWAGQAFTLLPWQWNEVIAPLFGWKRKDGTRRFRKAHVEVPKKNGKSSLCSGLSLYLLMADKEPGAEVYVSACDRDQASIVFNEARNMAKANPALARRLDIVDSKKEIHYGTARYKALSADVPTKEGLNIHGLVIDELHAQRDREQWDTLKYGGAARRQPLFVVITTAGVYDPASVGWEQHEYARQVLDGTVEDDAFFAYMRGMDAEDDWQSPEVWERVNPSWGVTINPTDFAAEAKEAQTNPATENAFRRYRLNQWVKQVTRWIPLHVWDQNWTRAHDAITEAVLRKRPCYGGLDLAAVSDLTAWLLAFPCEDDDRSLDILLRCWVPEAQLTNPRNRNRHLYDQWVRDGYLRTTPGNTTDYAFVRAAILSDAEQFDLQTIAVDRLFQGQQLATELDELLGLGTNGQKRVYAMGQGFISFASPMKTVEAMVQDGRIHHGGNPVLRWAVENVVVRMDPAGCLKPDKERSPEKIDPFVTLVMAVDQWERNVRTSTTESAYEHSGVSFLNY
jgi:phage terminase large subunit-like protein